jgi:hypothetical protein
MFAVCVYSHTSAACAALYSHMWPVWLYIIFPHFPINGTIFGKNVLLNINCVLIFSKTFVSNISRSKKNWARYDRKCIVLFMWNARYSDRILLKREFSRQIFEKYSNINFMNIRPVGTEFHVDGQMEKTNLIVALRILRTRLKIKLSSVRLQFMWFLCIPEQTSIIYLCCISWLAFIMEIECVYCTVRTVPVHTIHVNSCLLKFGELSEATWPYDSLKFSVIGRL